MLTITFPDGMKFTTILVAYNKPNNYSIKKYVDILMAHDLEPASLVNDVRDALECLQPKVSIYYRDNQSEKVKSVGWL